MRHGRRLLVAGATAWIVTLSAATPAGAATVRLFDPRGDAPASADVLSYTITNGGPSLRVAVKVRDLAPQSDITLYVNQAGAGEYVLRTAPVGKGTLTFERGVIQRAIHCGWTLTRLTDARSTLKLSISQACFGSRAGGAWVDLIMWQAGGQGSDNVKKVFVPRG